MRARLKWRCRRGMRELDVLLDSYMEIFYPRADRGARQAFARLLEMPDPVILSYVMGRAEPEESDLADVVRQIATAAANRG